MIETIPVPQGCLLEMFGQPSAYRDCFVRTVPGEVSLSQFIDGFYCSVAFRPERLILGLIGKGASSKDTRALAIGEADQFAAWIVKDRRENEILLQDFRGTTASWLSTRPRDDGDTDLLFGSWVGKPEGALVRALMPFHRWYSRVLLRGVRR